MNFQRILLSWYRKCRRDLPWRVPRDAPAGSRPNPYHVLISEAMLQQTQVATVIPYFLRFISELPTLADLAAAPEQQVLRLWQGLGYYNRARNLQRAAQAIMQQHGGVIPRSIEALRQLPGIGPYTAGAIASLAYDEPAALIDGNVTRVLCRIDAVTEDPRTPAVKNRLWARAGELVPREGAGDFNSALMELGATVCTPRNPQCPSCPVRKLCAANRAGIQEQIPPRAKPAPRPVERRWVIAIERRGRYLIEQRPPTGRWAGLWQFVTLMAEELLTQSRVESETGLGVGPLCRLGSIEHTLTHRQYQFELYTCQALVGKARPPRRWVRLSELDGYPLSRPQLRMAEMLRDLKPRI